MYIYVYLEPNISMPKIYIHAYVYLYRACSNAENQRAMKQTQDSKHDSIECI